MNEHHEVELFGYRAVIGYTGGRWRVGWLTQPDLMNADTSGPFERYQAFLEVVRLTVIELNND